RDLVVQIRLRVRPVPFGDHDRALDPCGRGGAGGTSPFAIRVDQSANIARARPMPRDDMPCIMLAPAWPDRIRRCQASVADIASSAAGISRVARVPSA